MTTYSEKAKFIGIRSKIDETDMLINAHTINGNDEMVKGLKEVREYLVMLLKNLEKNEKADFSFTSFDDTTSDSDKKTNDEN